MPVMLSGMKKKQVFSDNMYRKKIKGFLIKALFLWIIFKTAFNKKISQRERKMKEEKSLKISGREEKTSRTFQPS